MTAGFILLTLFFVVVSVTMILIILVQRPQGGGLAGAFGGAGGGGAESVFGGRVGDALTWATVIAFVVYLGVAISLNLMSDRPAVLGQPTPIDLTDGGPPGAAQEGITLQPSTPTGEFAPPPPQPVVPE